MLIVANWKAYVEDVEKARGLLARAKRLARRGVTVALAPPAPLFGLLKAARPGSIALCAQDISATTGGAHTGEATAQAYAAAGASYAIVGHSERRAVGDTDAVVAEKLAHAVAHRLTPILCVGERERDEDGRYLSFVRDQLTNALTPLLPKERGLVVVAYEPVWAIGRAAVDAIHPGELGEMVLYIRKVLAELLPGASSSRTRVLYGGSVEPENVRPLAAASGIDGLLVGHASVDGATWSALVKALA
ncbi:MAG: triose-phosphate isomerase [bacterium]|nr:triose-phosphate isomerase [bacterium]